MIMIVVLHFNDLGGVLGHYFETGNKLGIISFSTLEYLSIVAVNVYIFLTGYFMVLSKIKPEKLIKLWVEVVFYSLGIYLILVMTGLVPFTYTGLLKSVFPVVTSKYWFVTNYFALYLFIPFLNKAILSLNKTNHFRLLFLCFVLFTLFAVLPNNGFLLEKGYSVVWFVVLYLTAAYLRLYQSDRFHNNVKLILIYLLLVLIQVILVLIISKNSLFLIRYNSPIIYIESITLFLFFRNLHIKNSTSKKIIFWISPLVLSVYLVHQQSEFSPLLWGLLNPSRYTESWIIIVAFLCDIAIIFLGSIIIEKLRQIIFKPLLKRIKFLETYIMLINKLERKINRMM